MKNIMNNFVMGIILVLTLTGCSKPNKVHKLQQDYACAKHGGVLEYKNFGGNMSFLVTCMDGSLKEWASTVIPLEYVEQNRYKYEKEED